MPLPLTITSIGMLLTAQPLLASASAITSNQLGLHLGQAEALVWGKVSTRYTVPITPVPPLLESICVDLAVYGVLVKQAIIANTLEDSPWPDRYKEALQLLEDVADGEIPLLSGSLTNIQGGNAAAYTYGFSTNTNRGPYTPTYAELPSEYLEVDPEKETDLLSDRGITRG